MSLSNPRFRSGGRVIIGLHSKELDVVQNSESKNFWDEGTQKEFMERVKKRAQGAAREIIANAMREAEEIKSAAYTDGLQQGRKDARSEEEQRAKNFSKKVSKAMDSIATGREKIWSEYREDLVLLAKTAVDKILGWQMDEDREKVLSTLFEKSIELLDSGQEITVRVRPADKEIMQNVVDESVKDNPKFGHVQVVEDKTLEQGGVILESKSGIVDNSIQTRLKSIRQILDQVDLETGE
ncbi:MAG: FliH/SctL family protein [Thermodesulfobacteriota bacterium]